MLLNKCDNTYGMRPNFCNYFASLHRRRHFWFHEKNSEIHTKLREIAVVLQYLVVFTRKNQQIPNKNRENVVVLQFLAVFNFHFMRKIQKIDLIFSLLKSGIRGGEFILFQTKFCDLQTFRRRTVKLCCFSDFSYCHVVDHFLCFRLLQVLNLWLEELLHFFFIFRDWVILDQFKW